MNFGAPFQFTPRPYDLAVGREAADALRDCSVEARALLEGAAGCSPYLAGLIGKESAWLDLSREDMTQSVETEIASAATLPPDQLRDGLRRIKRRVALATALGDLCGAWPLEQVTSTLTRLADAACFAALRAAVANQIKRGKLPGKTEADVDSAAGMVVIAMGKMGASELNYSSDIDLVCLFDETQFDRDDLQTVRSGFVKATRAMSNMLSDITGEGYVFRTDLRLRPDPAVTPVCIAMAAAEHYYESLGRTWERAAYIKARPAAGDLDAGEGFLAALKPFVWRKHLDFAAIQDAHDMRLAIRTHKGLWGPITLPRHDMKLGRGGIREIEFFTQTQQLIAGGRDVELRQRGTRAGLSVLARKGWIAADVAEALEDHYCFHRTVEHRLQMIQDAQTHNLPKTGEGFERLAAFMNRDVTDLKQELKARLNAVHEMTEGFFAPAKSTSAPSVDTLDLEIPEQWMRYPALRSARSREVFKRVKPDLMARLAQTDVPEEAARAFDGFLSGLPAGAQLFSLLEANPSLTDLIIDISSTSPSLAQYLSRNAQVFDAVIGGDFFTPWPGRIGLAAALERAVLSETDYEARLDAARRWTKEWHFRIGVHFLRGLVSPEEASTQYSDLACAVVDVLWNNVTEQFARKYGPPPGCGAVVVGMGSLGARRLSPASDLDLIVIYDALNEEASTGKKSLSTRLYYARLTQSLITALSAPMAQGKLYEVDMRLRPSGNQGPVATSRPSFQNYQANEAWVWEHLALTRATVVTGPEALARDVAAFRSDLLCARRDRDTVMRGVADMRARIQSAKAPLGLLDAKIGPGRLQDIELLAQAGALLAGELSAETAAGLEAAASVGLISKSEASTLRHGAERAFALHMARSLLSGSSFEMADLRRPAQNFLMRTLEADTAEALERMLKDSYSRCDDILTRALVPFAPREDSP
ncbi:MAG: glutamine-synthetase adenylyltransferase [Pseudomonadota bacterium]